MESDHFEFKSPEIIPKKFEAILPVWEKLLESLSMEILVQGASNINRYAIDEEYEESIAHLLYDLYKKVKMLEVPEQRLFIEGHEPLRLALVRAKKIVIERN